MSNIRGPLVGKHANVAIVRQELAKHLGVIILVPGWDIGRGICWASASSTDIPVVPGA